MTPDDTMPDDTIDHSEPVDVGRYDTAGEAEIAQAKLRAYGIDSAISDQVEGGTVPSDGQDGVILQVRSSDGPAALRALGESSATEDEAPAEAPGG